jgi:hypothetical protein
MVMVWLMADIPGRAIEKAQCKQFGGGRAWLFRLFRMRDSAEARIDTAVDRRLLGHDP